MDGGAGRGAGVDRCVDLPSELPQWVAELGGPLPPEPGWRDHDRWGDGNDGGGGDRLVLGLLLLACLLVLATSLWRRES